MPIALILLAVLAPCHGIAATATAPQYLLFQIFLGGPDPQSGVFRRGTSKSDMRRIARKIIDAVRPARGDPDRILGFSIGPVAMDEGEDEARSVIRDAFEVAAESGLAVALHLDDYMFGAKARWPDGRLLRASPGTAEWQDWSATPAEGLKIGWLPNVKLAPQLCYENPEVKRFTTYWTRDAIGQEVKRQVDRLVQAGKPQLFAGVIVGWESNLTHGYCALSQLGYSAQNPPADFDHERQRVLQRHIERWAKGIYDAGIAKDLIFTHLATLPKPDYDRILAMRSRAQMSEILQSTALRAYWTAFNPYSNPGFSGFPSEGRYPEIYDAVRRYGRGTWAMVEGADVAPAPGGMQPGVDWERFLAQSFNHGARLANIFGGFQGEGAGVFERSTESAAAIGAYRKFLKGERLVEKTTP